MRLKDYAFSFLLLLAAAAFLFLVSYLSAMAVRPNPRLQPPLHSAEKLEAAEQRRDNRLDMENPPTVWREVDYSEGESGAWFPRGESPILRDLVAEGLLPPVAERVGPEPLVFEGPDGIGNFGGTWYRVANPGEIVINHVMSAATLVRWSPQGYPIKPHVARAWEVSDDGRVYTIHLRRGMRWSDGHPFTAADIVYWWDDMAYFDTYPAFMRIGAEVGRVEKVDDFTVRFIFPETHGLFIERLTHVTDFARPRHYLEQFHPSRGDSALIERTMSVLRVQSRAALYARIMYWANPEHPRLWPWVPRTHQRTPPFIFFRNPFFFAVDTEGNQLPYLDRVLFDVKSPGMIRVSLASGGISMQHLQVEYDDYTFLMEQQALNGFQVFHWFPGTRSPFTIFPNLNRRIDPRNPSTAFRHDLLNEVSFRRALSLAINRREIIRALYHNQVEPAQLSPGPYSPFHHETLYQTAIDYNPEKANRLLDELGLTNRDREGLRTFRDGSRMYFFLNVSDFTGTGPSQFLIDHWAAVGIRVILRYQNRNLWQAEQSGFNHDLTAWTGDSEFVPLLAPRNFVPFNNHSFFAPAFGIWYQLGGYYGDIRADLSSGFGPPPGHPLREAMTRYEEILRMRDEEERQEAFRAILDIAAENIWHITVSSPPPSLAIVKDGFRNVPRRAITGWMFLAPGNLGFETFFYDEPRDSPGAIAQVRQAMIEVKPNPELAAATSQNESPGRPGILINFLILGSIGSILLLLGLKHPYIGRRLLIMIPTLLVISLIVFTIIQLPPGDFLSTRITYLEMQGDEASVQAVRDLKAIFHYDRPQWERYLRWMGAYWFFTFESADRGLLQGCLGRSMQSGDFVNHIVGDRILLTFLISLVTILFTWAFAIPAGIFSAIRQYSIRDYTITIIGFLGMCIPNFLLALVLIHMGSVWFGVNISGLFSPEYAVQPEWTWSKFIDLMKHIWVPVLVLGTAGTAGMIRIMRANLLDELKKPYVVTARAKGVRPVKLLFKYPVRLAINPFISSIGGVFPALVSGDAIVAMVLSLPTVGPLMLEALLNQDMYLAGSMLMVLSLLGVMGTLVSDLLLLWLDPRTRLTGGTTK